MSWRRQRTNVAGRMLHVGGHAGHARAPAHAGDCKSLPPLLPLAGGIGCADRNAEGGARTRRVAHR